MVNRFLSFAPCNSSLLFFAFKFFCSHNNTVVDDVVDIIRGSIPFGVYTTRNPFHIHLFDYFSEIFMRSLSALYLTRQRSYAASKNYDFGISLIRRDTVDGTVLHCAHWPPFGLHKLNRRCVYIGPNKRLFDKLYMSFLCQPHNAAKRINHCVLIFRFS